MTTSPWMLLATLSLSLAVAASAPAAPVIDSGLIAAYEFTNGSVLDISGHGNDGTVPRTALHDDRFGTPGAALHFNGVSDEVILPADSDELESIGAGAFTVSAWVRLGAPAQAHNRFFSLKKDAGDSRAFHMLGIAGDGSLPFTFGATLGGGAESAGLTGGASLVGTTLWTDTASSFNGTGWFHVVFTRDALGDAALYVNGEVEDTATGATMDLGGQLDVNRIGRLSGEYTHGEIDDVYVYNRALSSTDVQSLFTGTAVPEPSAPALAMLGLGAAAWARRRR